MAFITPIFLLLGLLAIPIILLYMLRLRRQEMVVSSIMLWQKLLRDREANSPWQKLRRNLILLLQLLLLAMLVLALARPFIPVSAVVSGSAVVLLDGSASMQATDVEVTRFAAAKAQVNELIDTLGSTDQMTIIQVGATPTVLISASSDHNTLRQAVAAAQVGQGEANWEAAIALALGAAQGFQDARIAIVSDGGLPANLPPLPAETVYVPIGVSAENLAITALATRNTDAGPQLFASVRNYGQNSQEALLNLHLNDALYDSRRITVAPNESANLTWVLPMDAGKIEASLSEMNQDFLAADNTAYTVHDGGVSNRTLIVTAGNLFLEQIYSVLPGIEPFKASADVDLRLEEDAFDLYVFDSVDLPAPLPEADMLIINPPSGYATLFEVTGAFSNTATVRVDNNPILQFVDWSNIHVRQARTISAAWMQRLVDAEGGPMILTGERGNHRMAIISFDLHDSDLPLQIAFPILMSNITNWLSPGQAFEDVNSLQPSEPVELTPNASTTHVIVTKPDGREVRLEVTDQDLLFTETDQFGFYPVQVQDPTGTRPAGTFAINLFSEAESTIMPATTINLGQQTLNSATADSDVGQLELWFWLALIALLLLLVEWWVYHRGTRLPNFLRR